MDCVLHKTSMDVKDDVGKDFATDALLDFVVMALLMA
jgi:hypothetical protein